MHILCISSVCFMIEFVTHMRMIEFVTHMRMNMHMHLVHIFCVFSSHFWSLLACVFARSLIEKVSFNEQQRAKKSKQRQI